MTNPYESPKVESEFQPAVSPPSGSPARLQGCTGALALLIAPVMAWAMVNDAVGAFSSGDWLSGACLAALAFLVKLPWFWLPFAVRRQLRER